MIEICPYANWNGLLPCLHSLRPEKLVVLKRPMAVMQSSILARRRLGSNQGMR
jgi:hypothetical protein